MKKIIILFALILVIGSAFSADSWSISCTSCSGGSPALPSCGSSAARQSHCSGCSSYWAGRGCSEYDCWYNNNIVIKGGCTTSYYACNYCGGYHPVACPHGCSCSAGTTDCVAGVCPNNEEEIAKTCPSYACFDTLVTALVSGYVSCSCGVGYSNCDNNNANGCEQDLYVANGIMNPGCTSLYCSDGYASCNSNVYDGCETAVASNPDTCGGCGIKCSDALSCSGYENEAYRLGRTKAEICEFYCISGTCSALTKTTGSCSQTSQCVSPYNCINDNIENIGWCCPQGTCSYNGECYDANTVTEINSKYYYCKNAGGVMNWYIISRALDMSKMINSNHAEAIDDNLFFNDFGFANACSEGTACRYNERYSYNYCFSYNIVFDGMFNLETNSFVPVKVSEQDLYDPYAPTSVEINAEGCGDGNLNC